MVRPHQDVLAGPHHLGLLGGGEHDVRARLDLFLYFFGGGASAGCNQRGEALGGSLLGGLLALADSVVAVGAEDRAVTAGEERDLGGLATLVAHGSVELARGATTPRDEDAVARGLLALIGAHRAAVSAAAGAAHGVVLQALGGVELLLASGEDVGRAAIAAGQLAVGKGHGELLSNAPGWIWAQRSEAQAVACALFVSLVLLGRANYSRSQTITIARGGRAMGVDEPDVLSVGDADSLEAAATQYIRGELERAQTGPGAAGAEAYLLAALEGLPWVGGFIAAGAAMRERGETIRRDSLQGMWLEQHEAKLARLRALIDEMRKSFENLGEEVLQRVRSEEYLQLVRKAIRVWDQADTEEKRRYVANLLMNAGGGARLASDDVVRLFIEWLDMYHESHFTVIREIYQHPCSTRFDIWTRAWGEVPRENSAEADLYRRLIRDLSTGGVIRQEREVTVTGEFVRKTPARRPRGAPRSTTRDSSFDDEDPYELTELGEQFVHYTMNEVVDRIGGPGSA